jgi:hypothetical protein
MKMPDYPDMLISLRTELAQIHIRERQLLTLIENVERLLGQGEVAPVIDPENPKPFASMTYGDAAQQLLADHGPLPTRDLAELLLRGGARTKARNFVATIYSSLQKDGRFRLVSRRWHLKGDRSED